MSIPRSNSWGGAAALLGLLLTARPGVGGQPARTPLPPDPPTAATREQFFEERIRPVLASACYRCHSGTQAQAGLSLDSGPGLLRGGTRGPAIVPGKPDASLLLRAVRYRDAQLRMPPDRKLDDAQIRDLTEWVRTGARWPPGRMKDEGGRMNPDEPGKRAEADHPFSGKATAAPGPTGQGPLHPSSFRLHPSDHWSFRPVGAPVPPPDPFHWSDNPIDRFVAAELRKHGLTPGPPADRSTLVRRIYYDLVGLPPTPAERAAFLADGSPQAVEHLVDRLLASPRYGERWGRYWLDVARYSDTAGDNADYPIPEARRYRDYVIRSFNEDKPYDQLVREQIAGDLLARDAPPERFADLTVATGFLSLSRRYGTAPGELWHLTLEDTVDTFGRAFMGLTLRCARCHDHKYDPVTQRDYYALYGIFASTRFPYAGSEEFQTKGWNRTGMVPLVTEPGAAARTEQWKADIAKAEREVKELEGDGDFVRRIRALENTPPAGGGAAPQKLADLRAERERRLKELHDRLRLLQRSGGPPDVPLAFAVQDGTPVDEAVQLRGDPGNRGPVVPRGVPEFLNGGAPIKIPPGTSGRRELAEWLTRPDNPLTARVMVNRIWQGHFGKGLVATPSNFGRRGAAPTDPALLDWLTATFVAGSWGQGPGIGESSFSPGQPSVIPRSFGSGRDVSYHGYNPRVTGSPPKVGGLGGRVSPAPGPRPLAPGSWTLKRIHRLIILSRTYQLASADRPDCSAQDPDNRWYWRQERRRLDAEAIRDSMLSVSGKLDLSMPEDHPFPAISTWSWTQHNPFRAVYEHRHRSVYLMTQRIQRYPFLALFDGPDPNTTTDLRGESTVALQALYFMNNPFVQEQATALAGRLMAGAHSPRERIELGMLLAWSRRPAPEEIAAMTQRLESLRARLAGNGTAEPDREREVWTRFARVLLTANEFLYVD